MSSRPTSKARRKRQKLKRKFAKLREDCQLAGIIETTPEGALRDERVLPSAQEEDLRGLPTLVREALRYGWAVEDEKKPHLVDELVHIVLNSDMPVKAKIAAFNALRIADQMQWERDNLQDDKSAGPLAVNINVVTVDSAPDEDDYAEQRGIDHGQGY